MLAVDRRLNARDEEGNQVAQNTSTVTFEATPKIAEKIAVAQTIGSLSLSLRSIADNNAELERAIASGEVPCRRIPTRAPSGRCCCAIASQPIDTNPTYTIGSEVSRFQRSSVPGRAPTEGNNAPVRLATVGSAAGNPAVGPTGPVVRIARGNNVTLVPVGAR